MAPTKAYIPSLALLRALSRVQPQRCPLARPVITQFCRGKRTRAAKTETSNYAPIDPKQGAQMLNTSGKNLEDMKKIDKAMRPLSDRALESDDLPVINWYEQDLDRGTPQRLIERIATEKDRKEDKEMFNMIEESQRDPNYDDAKLNQRLLDSLISNPNFADLTQELKAIKGGIKTKEELAAFNEQSENDVEKESKEFKAGLRMATYQALQDLINDPDVGNARTELQEVLDKMPEMDEIDSPDFQAALDKANAKLKGNETFQKKMAAMAPSETDAELQKEWAQIERQVDEAISENDDDDPALAQQTPEDLEDVDKLLAQMRDVLKSLGGDNQLEAELNAVLSEDPTAEQQGDFEREMDPEELAEELKKLAQSRAPLEKDADAEENVPAELQAKVDRIMEDPRLMEKLVYIQKLIEQSESTSDITTIAHETAPDPYELEDARTATLKQRMQMAREDPEHLAALGRLNVKLLPPFNISPSLKSFNQAIELAYIGANDDIRRILWRSYQKARALPTFLQNVSDEAWDILYYSQAVTWGSNQNRHNHLRILLADLKSVGRDGPPTHPETLVHRGDTEHLED